MEDSTTVALQGISLLDGAILVLYLLGLTAIALYHSRKMHSQEDYFLAGRSMSQWPIAFSMFVALFSTNSFLGVSWEPFCWWGSWGCSSPWRAACTPSSGPTWCSFS